MKPFSTVPQRPALPHQRRGFTLVEMLISVTLVLLMMVMFAEIFTLASNSMTLQQAIADNDQQVRSFTTVFREDLHKRTVRTVAAFDPGENPDLQTTPYSERTGYFYLSLNDPLNATDNVLQFTVRSTIKLESGDENPYFGRSAGLVSLDPAVGSVSQAAQHVRSNSQQPEHDDGELQLNSTAASTGAEISYFVRGGRLYRRVVLLRDPLPVSGGSRTQPRMTWDNVSSNPEATPIEYMRRNVGPAASRVQTTAAGEYGIYDSATGVALSDDYWNDFDFAAHQAVFSDPMGNLLPDGAELLLLRNLDNELAATEALGCPRQRFGFDHLNGLSREFSHADPFSVGFFFLGRYTLEEMSSSGFNFPQAASILGNNPMSYVDVPALADAIPAFEPDGVVDAFSGGTRRGQDLLLSNVHAFEVEVWDDRVGNFLPLGHTTLSAGPDATPGTGDEELGDYHRARYRFTTSGLGVVPGDQGQWLANSPDWVGRTFDTWHPRYDHDGDDEDGNQNGTFDAGEDANGNGVFDRNYDPAPYRALTYYPPAAANGPYASKGFWQAGTAMAVTNYAVGDVVFPAANDPQDFSLHYICIRAGAETLTSQEPYWPLYAGGVINFPDAPTRPSWLAVRNIRPLRAIRLKVRFLHVASGKMRQLSLVHSLVD